MLEDKGPPTLRCPSPETEGIVYTTYMLVTDIHLGLYLEAQKSTSDKMQIHKYNFYTFFNQDLTKYIWKLITYSLVIITSNIRNIRGLPIDGKLIA